MKNHDADIANYRKQGYNWDHIARFLTENGTNETAAQEIVFNYKKKLYAKQRNRGLILFTAGAALCLFSLIFNFALGHNEGFLYGLTTVGVIPCLAGMVYILG